MGDNLRFNKKDMAIMALVACLAFLSIAYATISSTLTISNSLTVKAKDWDIHFENLEQESITGNNTAKVIKAASIDEDSTRISGLEVEFNEPGDYVSYTFDVKNEGEIDAVLSHVTIGTPTCTPTSALCDDIEYEVKYNNGNTINIADELNKNASIKVKLTIKYKPTSTLKITEDVRVSGLDALLVYSQK